MISSTNIYRSFLVAAAITLGFAPRDAQATLTIALFSGSSYNANTAAMDATLGITGLAIEDFEDLSLISGLSYTLTDPAAGTFTSLPNLFNTSLDPAWENGFWDGQNVLVNNSNNLYPNTGTSVNTITFNVAGGTTTFGVGLANFQSLSSAVAQFPINDHNLIVNGVSYDLESLANWTPGRTVRNGYLLIQASGADIINTVAFSNKSPGGDVMLFDHLAINRTAVPEPTTMALFGLGLAAAARRRRKSA